jgi:hypothetical protein
LNNASRRRKTYPFIRPQHVDITYVATSGAYGYIASGTTTLFQRSTLSFTPRFSVLDDTVNKLTNIDLTTMLSASTCTVVAVDKYGRVTSGSTVSVTPADYVLVKVDQYGQVISGSTTLPSNLIPSSVPDIQVFTASSTWNKPAQGTYAEVICIGGGGGGGSGANGSPSDGGSGGGGGGFSKATILFSQLSSSVTVTVGTGGAGGAAISVNGTPGNSGSAGGDSMFGNYVIARGGAGGYGGGGPYAAHSYGGLALFTGNEGGAGSQGDGSHAPSPVYGGAGGGGGGGGFNTLSAAKGGSGSSSPVTFGITGGMSGSEYNHGYDGGSTMLYLPGAGGGGGGSGYGTTGGYGGNGGTYGGGGGGGGSNNYGAGLNTGYGGAGAMGIVVVISK